jgi:hypothetical protein
VLLEKERLVRFEALLAFSSFIFALNSILDTHDLQQLVYVISFAGLTMIMVVYVLHIVTNSRSTDMSRKFSKHTARSKKEETVEILHVGRWLEYLERHGNIPKEKIPWKTTW